MIWFSPGRAIAQMSTESGPGVEEGTVLIGKGGCCPSLRAPTLDSPTPLHFIKRSSSSWNRWFKKMSMQGRRAP